MKRAMPVLLLAALATLAFMPAARAVGSSAPARPPGISASSWVPLTRDLGAVIEQRMPDRDSDGRSLPAALGYFVARRNGHWLRLDSLVLRPRALRSPPAASHWIVIDRKLRFAVEGRGPGQLMQGQPPLPVALGYFAIEQSGHWLRLQPDPQGALYRGPLRPPPESDGMPIGKGLRFVIEQQAPEREAGPGQLPSVLGYFVAEHEGRWFRLGSSA